jgi:hypothetical protein
MGNDNVKETASIGTFTYCLGLKHAFAPKNNVFVVQNTPNKRLGICITDA